MFWFLFLAIIGRTEYIHFIKTEPTAISHDPYVVMKIIILHEVDPPSHFIENMFNIKNVKLCLLYTSTNFLLILVISYLLFYTILHYKM
jgi:hypothetical protein